MRSLKLITSYYKDNELGYAIITAVLKEMLSQYNNRSWVLDIRGRIGDNTAVEYHARLLWTDGEYGDPNTPASSLDDRVLRMNYYEISKDISKNSDRLKLTEYNLEVTLIVERQNDSDKDVRDYVNRCYQNIQKTAAAVIEGNPYHGYGNSNLTKD